MKNENVLSKEVKKEYKSFYNGFRYKNYDLSFLSK